MYATMIVTLTGIVVFGVEFLRRPGHAHRQPGEVPRVQPALRPGAAPAPDPDARAAAVHPPSLTGAAIPVSLG
jgi:hypothetical protein